MSGQQRKHPLAKCEECPLYERPFVPTHVGGGDFVFVGEAPGRLEVQKGRPFVGQSGKLLEAIAGYHNIELEGQVLTNAVLCRPRGNREPSEDEMRCCLPRLEAELDMYDDKTVVAMGKTASQSVLAATDNNPNVRYSERMSQWFRSGKNGQDIICTWHPAYILRKPFEMRTLLSDVGRAKRGRDYGPLHTAPGVFVPADAEQLKEWLDTCPEGTHVAFDLETDNVVWYNTPSQLGDDILMLGMAWDVDEGIIVPHEMLMYDKEARQLLQEFFDREDLEFVAHNAKFDEVFLRREGLTVNSSFDTFLAHYVLWEEGSHGLKALAAEYYDLHDYEKKLIKRFLRTRNDRYSKVPFIHMAQYCVWDVCVTWALKTEFENELKGQGLLEWPFNEVIMRVHHTLADMEVRGIEVDVDYLRHAREYMDKTLQELERDLQREAAKAIIAMGTDNRVKLIHRLRKKNIAKTAISLVKGKHPVNIRSPQQVGTILYGVLGLPLPKIRGAPEWTTNKEALGKLEGRNIKFVEQLLKYRRVHKMLTSYVDNILTRTDNENRVHATFWINGTEVGRLSASDPALQTVPRPYEDVWGAAIRGSFVAKRGHVLIHADYSQAELRVAAVLSGEPFLLSVYREGRDLHSEVATAMYGEDFTREQRVMCKMFNFSYLYGGTEYSFANDAGLPISVARRFVRDYNNVMPRLAEWKEEQFQLIRKQGYVETPFGRRRRFPLITRDNIEDAKKACVHMPIASTAADLTLLSMCELNERGFDIVLNVHDAVLSEAEESVAEEQAVEIVNVMENIASGFFPEVVWKADADIGERWYNDPPVFEN